MKLRNIGLLFIILTLAISCKTTDGASTSGGQGTQVNTGTGTFNPATITEQHYSTTMDEVQAFINELNRIIANRNYQQWRARLSPEYFARISSPEFLAEVSEQPAMKTRRIILRTAEEYFIHVVVPSRQNSRVDTIEFTDNNKVIAYTVNTLARTGEEVRLRLYDLEKVNNSWIIIN